MTVVVDCIVLFEVVLAQFVWHKHHSSVANLAMEVCCNYILLIKHLPYQIVNMIDKLVDLVCECGHRLHRGQVEW